MLTILDAIGLRSTLAGAALSAGAAPAALAGIAPAATVGTVAGTTVGAAVGAAAAAAGTGAGGTAAAVGCKTCLSTIKTGGFCCSSKEEAASFFSLAPVRLRVIAVVVVSGTYC